MQSFVKNVGESTRLWAESSNLSISFKESCASTNDWAKQQSFSEPFKLFLTNHQTQGRGRGENQWQDLGEGQFLLSTWCFSCDSPPQHISAPLFGLALFESVRKIWPSLEWSLKAPNDLYLCDKKVGGLLLETIQQGSTSKLLVGLGLIILSAPTDVTNASHITGDEGTGEDIPVSKWQQFLQLLMQNMSSAATSCQKEELNSHCREALVEALNFNPLRQGLVLEISANGDIVMEKQTLSWKDI